MLKIYVSENLDKVLTVTEYEELLQRESLEYEKTIEELKGCDTDYTLYEITVDKGDQLSLLQLDNTIQDCINSNYNSVFDNIYDSIEYGCSYKLTDGNHLNIEFKIIENSEDNYHDIVVEITNIEII